eukprot:TRINITY_DN6226_c0_g1_i1.p1 TRINITY_DN6226_c0_g1~~TRINITY_DN6226_c0_g1_i1.p1  ORF type:complete len:868 (-),score=145.67 TRINITY_DN6226_c0_g1_i1:25-2628(-)
MDSMSISDMSAFEVSGHDAGNDAGSHLLAGPQLFVRERRKSIVATLIVVVLWASIFGGIFFGKHQQSFRSPSCTAAVIVEAKVCKPCGRGTTLLPLFGEYEKTWPNPLRGILYFSGLLWLFMGVGIVCDQFMGAIEEITSTERVVWKEVRPGVKHKFRVKIWNGTVANLTLMALGSSAPEILLNVSEITLNDFFAGDLGPSTIVGSAAFNLLVISAICVVALPDGELKKIENFGVFLLTATASVFAYIWLVIILFVISKDRVELWEALLTLCFFPILVIAAYLADIGVICGCASPSAQISEAQIKAIETQYGKQLPLEAMKLIHARECDDKPVAISKAAIRGTVVKGFTQTFTQTSLMSGGGDAPLSFGFARQSYTVLECCGTVKLRVVASRRHSSEVCLQYTTRDGSAKAGVRYSETSGTVIFLPLQMEQVIDIPILDNDVYDADQVFYVSLTSIEAGDVGSQANITSSEAAVTIINDDLPGILDFDTNEIFVDSGSCVRLGVIRKHGTSTRISCQYRTVDVSAVGDRDYKTAKGEIVFEDGEVSQTILLEILTDRDGRNNEVFKVVLDCASPGVKFNADTDGGSESAVCDVTIHGTSSQAAASALTNHDMLMKNCAAYSEQITSAFICNGSFEEQANASVGDWIFHALTLCWKVLFLVGVPPRGFFGGWLSFLCALTMIGFVTIVISDMAGLFGCVVELQDEITAITLVALGTSLPDTLASKLAAQVNPTADDCIGNVTGSNCVNVFLGLGLPWTIGALFWHFHGRDADWDNHLYQGEPFKTRFGQTYREGGFMVPAGSLTFSVVVFTVCATCCIGVLVGRRSILGGELGGSKRVALLHACFLVSLWLIYVVLSIVFVETPKAEQ